MGTQVLLATSAGWPEGEPGGHLLPPALAARGIAATWAVWDDPAVDWAAADLVVVRSTWDYTERPAEFLDWARRVERGGRLLHGAEVFAWNLDKAYLTTLPGPPVVPTMAADTLPELAAAVATFGTAVVKPRVGAGGAGVLVVDDPLDARLGQEIDDHPELHNGRGPWVVQPLVESVRTEGETSVFLLGGRAVCQVDKTPAAGEIRVHEHFGGASTLVSLREEAVALAVGSLRAAERMLDVALHYGRADMVRLADGRLAVSELELIEPGLYLDVAPANADAFAQVVAGVVAR